MALSLFATACAPLTPDTRRVARAEHARQAMPPATPPPARHHEFISWSLEELAAGHADAVELHRGQDRVAIIPGRALKALRSAAERMTRVVNLEPPAMSPNFQVIAGYPANAFAMITPGQPVIAVNFGLIDLLLDDEALWATVIGHELAHLKYQHQQKRTARQEWGETVSGVFSVVLGFAGVPIAPLLSSGAANMVNLGYSREDELDADAHSLAYLRQAGYDPGAALRFHERLAVRSGNQSGSLLSTHPGSTERIEAIRRQLETPTTR